MSEEERSELGSILRKTIRSSGLSLAELGRKSHVDHTRLSRFLSGQRDLTLEAVEKLCHVLGIHFTHAGPIPETATLPKPQNAAKPPARPRRRKTEK